MDQILAIAKNIKEVEVQINYMNNHVKELYNQISLLLQKVFVLLKLNNCTNRLTVPLT